MNKKDIFLPVFLCFVLSAPGFCNEGADVQKTLETPAVEKVQSADKKFLEDEIVETILKERDVQKPYTHTVYDYKSLKKTPIRISIKERIKTEADVYEGQIVEFQAESNVYYKKQLRLKKGDTIKARVATIISSGMNGIPASIIFEFIEIPNIKREQATDTLEVFGQDRSLFVFPLKWALTFLPPTGSLTNFIMGGHVRIREGKVFTIYYHPEWL